MRTASRVRVALLFFASAGLYGQPLKIEVLRVRPNVYMLASPSGNMVVQLGEQNNADGVLLVDTLPASAQVLEEIRKLSSKPLRYILNTSANASRTGGNAEIGKTGKALPAFSNANFGLDSATVIAQDEVLTRMSRPKTGEARPFADWPTLTFDAAKDFHFNGEPVQMIHVPHAHSDGDALVFLRNSNVIATGEIFTTIGYPKIDLDRGGGIQGMIDPKLTQRLVDGTLKPDHFSVNHLNFRAVRYGREILRGNQTHTRQYARNHRLQTDGLWRHEF